jgi:hypothetical protein
MISYTSYEIYDTHVGFFHANECAFPVARTLDSSILKSHSY